MDEVDALVRALLADGAAVRRSERLSYREVFQRALGLDPFSASPPGARARRGGGRVHRQRAASPRDECSIC